MTEDEWIARNAAVLLEVLADENVRAEVVAQLGSGGSERRREAARRELEALGLLGQEPS